jgi:hypothetical protein
MEHLLAVHIQRQHQKIRHNHVTFRSLERTRIDEQKITDETKIDEQKKIRLDGL